MHIIHYTHKKPVQGMGKSIKDIRPEDGWHMDSEGYLCCRSLKGKVVALAPPDMPKQVPVMHFNDTSEIVWTVNLVIYTGTPPQPLSFRKRVQERLAKCGINFLLYLLATVPFGLIMMYCVLGTT